MDASTYDYAAADPESNVYQVASGASAISTVPVPLELFVLYDQLALSAIHYDDHGGLGGDRIRELAKQIKALRNAR